MSAIIETHIMCDQCAKQYGIDFRTVTAYTQRKWAKESGWKYVRGKDFCSIECKNKYFQTETEVSKN